MRTIKLAVLFIIYNLTFSISYAQSPVDSVSSGCALDFNGTSNYVHRVGEATILENQNLTVEAWIKKDSSTTPMYVVVYRPKGAWSDGRGFQLQSDKFVKGSGDGSWEIANTTTPVDEWYHIAGTYDGNVVKIYVNGVLKNTHIPDNQGIEYNDKSGHPFEKCLLIGSGFDNNGVQFYTYKGQIDEVRIWNYARTQTEIRQNMCKKLTGTEAGLVGYWRFDDCGGLTATDNSGNGNNGTLY